MRIQQGNDIFEAKPSGSSWFDSSAEAVVEGPGVDSWGRIKPALEQEIIPRLMMAFQSQQGSQQGNEAVQCPTAAATDGDVEEFIDIVLYRDVISAVNYVQGLRIAGASLQAVYLNLVSDAARRLGQMWENDECGFFDVTVGVNRLQQMMMEFSHCFRSQNPQRALAKFNALIVPMPGEQHTFGQFTVVEFFRRAGWNVNSGFLRSIDALEMLVAQQPFDLVGLSIAGDRHVDRLDTTIRRLREASHNPNIKIMIGGYGMAGREGLVEDTGADATASNASAAVAAADRLVSC